MRFWLQQLKTLEPLATTDTLRQALLQLSDQAFHTPDWEPWRKHAGFAQTAILPDQQLLGKQRQVLLWVNGLLPFFLTYARQHQEPELESLLYRLLLVLPPEPEKSAHALPPAASLCLGSSGLSTEQLLNATRNAAACQGLLPQLPPGLPPL